MLDSAVLSCVSWVCSIMVIFQANPLKLDERDMNMRVRRHQSPVNEKVCSPTMLRSVMETVLCCVSDEGLLFVCMFCLLAMNQNPRQRSDKFETLVLKYGEEMGFCPYHVDCDLNLPF